MHELGRGPQKKGCEVQYLGEQKAGMGARELKLGHGGKAVHCLCGQRSDMQ